MTAKNAAIARPAPPMRKPASSRPKLKGIQGGRAAGSKAVATRTARASAHRRPGKASRAAQASASHPARIVTGLAAIGLSAVLVLALVLLNVYVAQSSFRLDELQKQVSAEQNRYRQMRYEVSMAQSPARLAEAAANIGLVTPVHQESLQGRPIREVAGTKPGAQVSAGPNLKAVLADRP